MLTDLSFVHTGAAWPPVDADTVKRMALYDRNVQLYEGMHEHVLRLRQILLRTDNLTNDKRLEITLVLDWFRRLSTRWADLMWGEAPRFKSGKPESPEQVFLDLLVKENDLVNEGQQVTVDQSRFGAGLWKTWYDGERVRIQAQTPLVWYVVTEPDNVKETVAHVLAWKYDVVDESRRKSSRLRVEIHTAGNVERHLYKCTTKIGAELFEAATPTGEEKATVADVGLLVEVVNNSTTSERAWGYDDYSRIESLVQAMEALLSQVASIIQYHADPTVVAPPSAFSVDPMTGERRLGIGGARAMTADGNEAEPKYLVWDAQLASVFTQFSTLLEQLYMLSETSPAAFGQIKAGLAESGSALKRLLLAPLAKTNRLRNRMDAALKRVLENASKLALDRGVAGAVLLDAVQIDWRDGLPQDITEAIAQESTAYAAGLTSRESALRRLWGLEGKELEEEMTRIEEEEAAAAPPLPLSTDFGTPPKKDGTPPKKGAPPFGKKATPPADEGA